MSVFRMVCLEENEWYSFGFVMLVFLLILLVLMVGQFCVWNSCVFVVSRVLQWENSMLVLLCVVLLVGSGGNLQMGGVFVVVIYVWQRSFFSFLFGRFRLCWFRLVKVLDIVYVCNFECCGFRLGIFSSMLLCMLVMIVLMWCWIVVWLFLLRQWVLCCYSIVNV